jgi:hypothetical protein
MVETENSLIPHVVGNVNEGLSVNRYLNYQHTYWNRELSDIEKPAKLDSRANVI